MANFPVRSRRHRVRRGPIQSGAGSKDWAVQSSRDPRPNRLVQCSHDSDPLRGSLPSETTKTTVDISLDVAGGTWIVAMG